MRIAILNTLYAPYQRGGAEVSVRLLAEALVHRGHHVLVITTVPFGKDDVRTMAGVKVSQIGLRNLYWPKAEPQHTSARFIWHIIDIYNPWMRDRVGRIFSQWHPDVLHTNNLVGFSPSVWEFCKVKDIPVVHTLRDYSLACPRSTMFRSGRNCAQQCRVCNAFSWWKRRMSEGISAVVGISEYILRRHIELGFFSNVQDQSVIYNATRGGREMAVGACLQQWARDQPSLRFGYLGRIAPEKGVEVVLDGFSAVPPTVSMVLRIAGCGDLKYTRNLRTRFLDPRISWLGYVEAAEFFDGIDVLLVPSLWHEPMGRIIVEAFSHGVPVIAANRGAIPELVSDGITGLVFDPSCDNLAAVLMELTRAPERVRTMRTKCLLEAKRYHPEIVADRYQAVYARVTAST